MSKEQFTGSPMICRQRFKGVENFLRRIAFNLGNTPSQTEVKIISCIPIDVTDLQQKILHLEKQLDDVNGPAQPSDSAKGSKSLKFTKQCSSKKTTVNTAIVDSKFPEVSTAAVSCKSLDCDQSTSPTCLQQRGNKSNVSFIFPNVNAHAVSSQPFSCGNSELSQVARETIKANFELYESAHKMSEQKPSCHRKNFFSKKKKKSIKYKKGPPPLVYYAQTNNSSPFTRSEQTEDPQRCENDVMTRSYLAEMINKQYKPKIIGDNLSILSQISSPVCKDVPPHIEGACRCESDICSCCYGPFHNIDNHVNKLNNPQTYMLNEIHLNNMYYDTNQYDMIPVKEKPVKPNAETARKKSYCDVKCWPETIRSKFRRQSLDPILASNLCMAPPPADCVYKDKFDIFYRKKMPPKLSRIEPIVRKVKRRKEIYKRERPLSVETSKSCCIDFGSIYSKKHHKKPKKHEVRQTLLPSKKNAECLTNSCNNIECQTTMNITETKLADGKTEQTLNQIKVILQSVLAEVKVTQTKNQVIRDETNKPKKDAVVQKSHNNMYASSLMNSFPYNPYNTMNPSAYLATCSRHLGPGQVAVPGVMPNPFYYSHEGMKCFHNFPLFLQTGGRPMCASCYRNSSNIKHGYIKHATTIATNTDEAREEHTKETEKLIKEIYKSMALTMDYPNKDTSLSEYEDVMKPSHGFTTVLKTEPKKEPMKIKNVVQAVSELFIKKDMADTSETLNTTIDSKELSNEVTTQSQIATTTDTADRMRNDNVDNYTRTNSTQPTDPELQRKVVHEALLQNSGYITETDTSSSEDTGSTTTASALDTKQKKEKRGLFSKMLKSVKLFKIKEKPKQRNERTESEEESTSDSDDYQTVYSQKIEKSFNKNRSRSHNVAKRRTHSKISYKQTYQREKSPEKKRSPYMEQEYRRYWDERLMFQENRAHSSERIYSDRTHPRSPYYRAYEARSADIQAKPICPKTERKTNGKFNSDNTLTETSRGMAWLRKH